MVDEPDPGTLQSGAPAIDWRVDAAESFFSQGRYDEAEPLLKRSLRIREERLGPDHPQIAVVLHKLAMLHDRQGRYADAELLLKRALVILEVNLGPDNNAFTNVLDSLARLYVQLARYNEAEPLFMRVLSLREQALGPDHILVGASLNGLGGLYLALHRYSDAEQLYRRALLICEKQFSPEHPIVATNASCLASAYRLQHRYAAAEALCKRALVIRWKALGPNHPETAGSLSVLAELCAVQGRFAEAEPLMERALEIYDKALGADHPEVARVLNDLARLYDLQGRDSFELRKRALEIREKRLGPDHPDVAIILSDFADRYAWFRALGFSRRAVALLARHLSATAGSRMGAWEMMRGQFRRCFLRNIELLHAASQAAPESRTDLMAESFTVAQVARKSSAAAALSRMAARFASIRDELGAVIRQRQDLLEVWRGLNAASLAAAMSPSDRRVPTEQTKLREKIAAAAQWLEELDTRIAHEFPAFQEFVNPPPLLPSEVQGLLAANEALLVFFFDLKSFLWVVRADRFDCLALEIDSEVLRLRVTELRRFLDPTHNGALAPFPARKSYQLYCDLVAPAEALLDGVQHLILVPDDALQSLPLSVLISQNPEKEPQTLEDHRALRWLGMEKAVTVLPSVSSLKALRKIAKASKGPFPFLGVGDPDLEGPSGWPRRTHAVAPMFRGEIANTDAVRALAPLPETAEELRAIAGALGAKASDLYLRARAREPLLRQASLDQYKVVAFATHALVSGELEGLAEPALVLTPPSSEGTLEDDGLLTASKIATLKLDCDLVVLSACNTAATDGSPDADGLSGLAKAFFYAGARAVLVSHWPVWSDATIALTTNAFAELKQEPSIGRAEALRRSMRAMLDPANPVEFAHPLAWGPFTLAGEGGPTRSS